eukprot:GILI01030288.1.p1 GENE.GILI01030288.1~~GILI01030288.1.p1  ORF type:complete len:334 (-),score=42.01 GILI01030288.1:77-982(-)
MRGTTNPPQVTQSTSDFLQQMSLIQSRVRANLDAHARDQLHLSHTRTPDQPSVAPVVLRSYDAFKDTPPPRSQPAQLSESQPQGNAASRSLTFGSARMNSDTQSHSPSGMSAVPSDVPLVYRLQWEAMAKRNAELADKVDALVGLVLSLQTASIDSSPDHSSPDHQHDAAYSHHPNAHHEDSSQLVGKRVSFIDDEQPSPPDASELLSAIVQRQVAQEYSYQLIQIEQQCTESRLGVQMSEREALVGLMRFAFSSMPNAKAVVPPPAVVPTLLNAVPPVNRVRVKRDPLELSMALWTANNK